MTQPNSKPAAGAVQAEFLKSVTERQAQTRERLGWAAPKPPASPQSVPPQETV